LSFGETLRGTVAFGVGDPRQAAYTPAAKTDLAVDLTIGIGDVNRFLTEPSHSAELTGWVRCDALGGKLPVETGEFNLLVQGESSWSRKMLYRVWFRDGAGHMLTLAGEKQVRPALQVKRPWRDTTTLFTRVLRGRIEPDGDARAEIVAAGILYLRPLGLAHQLLTYRAAGPGSNRAAGLGIVGRFVTFFLGTVARVYLRD
jgi:cholesterol oxidase